MTLAEKITALRGERKLSQGDVAEKLDVSRQSVSKWETGQAVPELDKIIKLADLFGVSVDELVRDGEMPAPEAPQTETPTAQTQAKIVYVERKGLSPVQTVGAAALAVGALMLFLGRLSVYVPITGIAAVILSLPLLLAKKHPFLIAGWLLCLGSCAVLNPLYQRHTLGAVGRNPGAARVYGAERLYRAGIPRLSVWYRYRRCPGSFGAGAALFHRAGLPAPVGWARPAAGGRGQPARGKVRED